MTETELENWNKQEREKDKKRGTKTKINLLEHTHEQVLRKDQLIKKKRKLKHTYVLSQNSGVRCYNGNVGIPNENGRKTNAKVRAFVRRKKL